jgi:hypothetical protein
MIGLLFFVLIAIWLYVSIWLSLKISRRLPFPAWRSPLTGALIAVFMVLPLIDEVVGAYQFKELCRKFASTIQIDLTSARGRTIYFARETPLELQRIPVRVEMRPVHFVDIATGETVVAYNELSNGGGWLSHPLRLSFTQDHSSPPNRPASIETFKPYGITYVEPPQNVKRAGPPSARVSLTQGRESLRAR